MSTEHNATRNRILATLDELAQTTPSESTILIYFSGHGYLAKTSIGKSYFLMLYHYQLGDLSKTAITDVSLLIDLPRFQRNVYCCY